NRGNDLQTIANDAFIGHQLFNASLIIFRNLRRREVIEAATIVVALSKNSLPTQARLRAFQDQKLEKCALVVSRNSPFMIVISDRQISHGPMATTQFLFSWSIQIDCPSLPFINCSIAWMSARGSTGL